MKINLSAREIEEIIKEHLEKELGLDIKPGDISWNHDGVHPIYPVTVKHKE